MPPTSGATPRKAPPEVATTFPPRANFRNSGRQWPSGARDNAGEMADVDRRQQRGNEPLQRVEQHHRHAVACAVRPPDVGRTDVPAPDLPDVLAPEEPDEPVPVGMLPARYPTNAKSAVLRASTPQG